MVGVARSSASRTLATALRAAAAALPLLAVLLMAPSALADTAPEVTQNPSNAKVLEGEEATFEATASGTPTPTVQWEIFTNAGMTWEPIIGQTLETLKVHTESSLESGDEYRATFTNVEGETATTGEAILTVEPVPPQITMNPLSKDVVEGEEATFTTAASGGPTLTVQWEISRNAGMTWEPMTDATSDTLQVKATSTSESGDEYRATFTNAAGESKSTTAATLTVKPRATEPKSTETTGNSDGGAGAGGGGASTPPPSPAPTARTAKYLALTIATAHLVVKGAVAFHFKYAPARFHATHCLQRASGRYRCNVSWRHREYAFLGAVEVGNLNVYTGHYTYGLRVVRTNTRTRRHRTLTVPY